MLKKGLENVLEKVHKKVLSQDITKKVLQKVLEKILKKVLPSESTLKGKQSTVTLPEKCVTNLGRSIYCKIALAQIKHTINNVGDCYLCETES